MFLWQFPHFMAIAWLYRDDYARGGQRMLTVVDPTGLRAAGQAIVAAILLVPVSLVPALAPEAGSPLVYSFWTLLLGIGQVAAAVWFLTRRDDRLGPLAVASEPGLSHVLDGPVGHGRRVTDSMIPEHSNPRHSTFP